MRRLFISLLGILVFPIAASAGSGSASGAGWTLGAKAGLNVSEATFYLHGDAWQEGSRVGPVVGAAGIAQLSPRLDLQLEALLGEKGYFGLTTHYLEFPALLRVVFPTRGALMPYAVGGGSLALLLNARNRAGHELTGFARTDLSVIVGVGAEIYGSGFTPTIEARYTHGITDVDLYEAAMFNRTVSILGGLLF